MIRRCPVCRRTVHPSIRHNIVGHTDTIGETCPASGYPFYITELVTDSVSTTPDLEVAA